MKVPLMKEDCYCSLLRFYETVAAATGVTDIGNAWYDCRKICVTKDVQDMLWDYYRTEESMSDMEITTLFLHMGPKAVIDQPGLYLAEANKDFVCYKRREKAS